MISVIIPARNAAATIAWSLGGLAAQDFDGEWEVIVVDDGSSDATVELVRAAGVDARVLREDGVGPALARNAGAASATGTTLAFLDADCRPTESWLRSGVRALERAELVQGATHPDPAEPIGPFDRTISVRRPSPLYESANLFVRCGLFGALEGFESWLGRASGKELGEDVWFGWRARRLGARTAFCAEAVVHHAVFPRGAVGYVGERARLRYFPPLARRIPELREQFFYRRWFLSARSAAYDLALAGCVAAAVSRRPLALAAAAPYAAQLITSPRGAEGRILAAELAADTVSFAALLAGSLASGSLLL